MNDTNYGYVTTVYPLMTSSKKEQDCISFLLKSHKYGWIIFDTGSFKDRDSFVTQLEARFNITPDDFSYVFNTHLHYDHFGNNELFKNAKIFLSKKELDFFNFISHKVIREKSDAKVLTYLSNTFPGYDSISLDFAGKLRHYFTHYWDVRKLGSKIEYLENNRGIPDFIKPLPTPGHTPHHYSYRLSIDGKLIYIMGDAIAKKSILSKDITQKNTFGLQMDYEQYFFSLDSLRSLKGLIVPGHDNPFLQ